MHPIPSTYYLGGTSGKFQLWSVDIQYYLVEYLSGWVEIVEPKKEAQCGALLVTSFSGQWPCLFTCGYRLTTAHSIKVSSLERHHMSLCVDGKIKLFVFLFSRSGWRPLCGGGLSQQNLRAGERRRALRLHRAAPLRQQWVTPAPSNGRGLAAAQERSRVGAPACHTSEEKKPK